MRGDPKKNEAVREKSGPRSAQETRVKSLYSWREEGWQKFKGGKTKEAERDEGRKE